MIKSKTQKTYFKCKSCGHEVIKWVGKCPSCQSWNSFEEKTQSLANPEAQHTNLNFSETSLQIQTLQDLQDTVLTNYQRQVYTFEPKILNNFWGKGLVATSFTLLAGEPGLGKSTFALQLLRTLWKGFEQKSKTSQTQAKNLKLLYITAEESVIELAHRSNRLGLPKQIQVLQANNFEQIIEVMTANKPDIAIIDSVQTIYSSKLNSNPGSVAQVSTIASQLLAFCKQTGVAIILIGHVTKDGQIAGPKTLEHLVDSVLILESTNSKNYRTLSFSKNRFGSTEGVLLLKMKEEGLQIVSDPSLALLENIEAGFGVCYGIGMDKDMPLIVEIQALVSKVGEAPVFGKREAIGFNQAKLNTILAIMDKYLGLSLKNYDVYVQMSGLPKKIQDDSLDLPILLAIYSSLTSKSLSQIFTGLAKDLKTVFAGRLTLSGKLRKSTNQDFRCQKAQKLGFEYNPQIKPGQLDQLFR